VDELRIVVVRDDEANLEKLAEEQGLSLAEDEDIQQKFEPGTVIILTGQTELVGRFIMSLVEKFHGGVRMDMTAQPPLIKRSSEIPYGFIYLFFVDGEVEVDAKADALGSVVEAVFSLPFEASADSAKSAIAAARESSKAGG